MMKRVKKKVPICMCTMPHFAEPCKSYKRKFPMRHYNVAIYLNNHRVKGSRDYNGTILHEGLINTLEILKALDIPQEIIDQIKFEDNEANTKSSEG